jgi:exonuclease SbcC
MLIKKVRLKNIRSYINEEIKFPEGSTLLAGDIGSGKSTILLAIEFAFFGLKRGELSGETLLRAGTREGNVEVTFTIDSKEIVISRNISKGKDSIKQEAGFIAIDGVKEDMTPVELKAKVFELFGYPIELVSKGKDIIFRYTVYTPQEEMKRILFDDPESRLDTLRVVFNVDKYKKVQDNAVIFAKETRTKIRELNAGILDLEAKKAELEKDESELQQKGSLLHEINKNFRHKKEIAGIKKQNLDREERNNELYKESKSKFDVLFVQAKEKSERKKKLSDSSEKLKQQIAELRQRHDSIHYEKLDFDEISLQKQINAHKADVDANREGKAKTNADINSLKERIASFDKEKQKKQDLIKSLDEKKRLLSETKKDEEAVKFVEKELKRSESELDEKNRELASVETLMKNSHELKTKILELDSCPICLQKVDEGHKHSITEKEEAKLNELDTQLNALTKEIKMLEHKKAELSSKKQEIEEAAKKEASLVSEIRFFESSIKDFEMKEAENHLITKRLEESESILIKLNSFDEAGKQAQISHFEQLRKKVMEMNAKKSEKDNIAVMVEKSEKTLKDAEADFAKLDEEVEAIKSQLKETQSFLDAKKDTKDIYSKARSEHESALKEMQAVELEKVAAEKEIEGLQRIINSLKAEIEIKQKSKEKIEYLKRLQGWLEDYFVNVVASIEKQIMARIHYEFNNLFRTWFSMLIEDDLINARLDDSFTPLVEQNGYEIGVENLSGGEKTSCALAYRLALNKVINDLISTIRTRDIIILDEPTDGFSSEQLDKVRLVLDELKMKQILLVSHESKIESFVQNIIRIAKTDHTSRILV